MAASNCRESAMHSADIFPTIAAILGVFIVKVKVLELIKQHKSVLGELVPALKAVGPQAVPSADGKSVEIHGIDPVAGYQIHTLPIATEATEATLPEPDPNAGPSAAVDPKANPGN